MFKQTRTDRRARYSFKGHLRRAVETKGVGRIALSLAATAIIGGAAFANCSSSNITGPSTTKAFEAGGDLATAAPVTSAAPAPSGPSGTETIKEPVPMQMPFTTVPPNSPCTLQPILWDKMKTMMQGTTQITLSGDRYHAQFHLNSQAQGVTDREKAPGAPVRRYAGSEEYNSQILTILSNSTDRVQFEWNMKIVAKGEDNTLFPEDDFYLHVVARFGPPPTFTPEEVTTYGRCN